MGLIVRGRRKRAVWVSCVALLLSGCGDNRPATHDDAAPWVPDAPPTDAPSDVPTDVASTAPTWPAGRLRAVPTGLSTATLTWTAAIDDVGVTSYHVYQDGALLADLSGTTTSLDVTGLVVGAAQAYRVEASDADGNTSVDGPRYTYIAPPADPSGVATPIDPSLPTDLASSTAFIYTGASAVQVGVAPGTIDPRRVVLLRGKVLDTDGAPLAGATISLPDHPEYGTTLSRADGVFDFATNGGGLVTVRYTRPGYIAVDRQVRTRWNEYDTLPTVVMTAYDPKVTTVDLASISDVAVARGSIVDDSYYPARQTTMLFSPGTTATMRLPDGSSQPLTTLNVRATEFTVGPNGPKAMPGELPAGTAYTYCVELSVDEAEAAGARTVEFSQPVPVYVENFMGFPVGSRVPLGYYDRSKLAWVGMPDGRVIEVTGVTGGLADLDVDGLGPADAAKLAGLGISDAERRTLATTYTVGAVLQRFSTTHFTPIDGNPTLYIPPPRPIAPDVPRPTAPRPPRADECKKAGSVIDCRSRTLRETLPIRGTPFSLWYSSADAGVTSFDIPLTSASPPPNVDHVVLEVTVMGQSTVRSFAPTPSQTYAFVWDGKDAFGRDIYGATEAKVTVSNVYKVERVVSGVDGVGDATSFARELGAFLLGTFGSSSPDDGPTWYSESVTTMVPLYRRPVRAVAAWGIDVHHVWDARVGRLYAGTGEDWATGAIGAVIEQPPGGGQSGLPLSVSVGADGTAYFGGTYSIGGSWAGQLDTTGAGKIFAGMYGNTGFCGDGGPANMACLNNVTGVQVGPAGEVYIVDSGNQRIRMVRPDGIITTVAGNGTAGYAGDGGPATSAEIDVTYGSYSSHQIGVARDGTLYIPDRVNHRIRRVLPDGIIDTIAGNGSAGYAGDGGSAREASLDGARGVAVAEDGSLYIADTGNNVVRRVGADGVITTVAGGGTVVADVGPATSLRLNFPHSLAIDRDGGIYISESHRIRYLTRGGELRTIAGTVAQTAGSSWPPYGTVAPGATLGGTFGISVAPDGALWVAYPYAGEGLRRIAPARGKLAANEVIVPSPDGAEAYVFDAGGRHLRTVDPITGATRLGFGYDAASRLVSVTDAFGNQTQIARDPAGAPTRITAPGGEITLLSVDATGKLSAVTDPRGTTVGLTYLGPAGRLDTITRPARGTSTFQYDGGLLVSDTNGSGATKLLTETEPLTASDPETITFTSAAGRATIYSSLATDADQRVRQVTSPTGATVTRTEHGAKTTTTHADGTTLVTTAAPAPRWGMLVPYFPITTQRMPATLATTITSTSSQVLSNPSDLFSVTSFDQTVTSGYEPPRTLHVEPSGSNWTQLVTTPAGARSLATLTPSGALIGSAADDRFAATVFTLDNKGFLTAASTGSATWSYVNDASGRAVMVTDPLSRLTLYQYDANGLPIQKTLPSGNAFALGRNAAGDITSLTLMPSGAVHSFAYSLDGQLTGYTPPAGDAMSITYNVDGQPLARSLASDRMIVYQHDAGGRTTKLDDGRASSTLSYVGNTRRVAQLAWAPASGPAQTLAFSYNGPLVTSRAFTGPATGTYQYQYDNGLRVVGVTFDAGPQRVIQRDADGHITQNGSVTYTRLGPRRAVSGLSDGTGTWTMTFDPAGRPVGRTLVVAGATIYDEQLGYDAATQVTTRQETAGAVTRSDTFTYDLDGQLVGVERGGVPIETYSYDTRRNRVTRTDASNTVESSTYDARDGLTSRGAVAHVFDAAGFLAQRGADTFAYTTRSELLAASVGGNSITYTYDGYGRRTSRTEAGGTTQYLYGHPDNDLAVTEARDPAGVLSTFLYDGSFRLVAILRAGATYYVATDAVGTPRLVTDATGAIVKQIERDTFGRLISDSAPGFFLPIGFAGGLEDPTTGLVRLGARDYDPMTGRFTSRDPVLYANEELSHYAYAQNAPSSQRDPGGLKAISVGFCVIACAEIKVAYDPETGDLGYCSAVGIGTPSASLGYDPAGKPDPNHVYMTISGGVGAMGVGYESKVKHNFTECGWEKTKHKGQISRLSYDAEEVGFNADFEADLGIDAGPLSASWQFGACMKF